MKFSQSNNTPFYVGLRQRVAAHFSQAGHNGKADLRLWVKGGLLVGIYVMSYVGIYYWYENWLGLILLYGLMGVSGVMIVFNIVHDAAHGAISPYPRVNKALTYLGDLVGINTYIWHIRHNIQHHTFTNILGGDLIIENIPLIRLSQHQNYRPHHRFQVFYAPVLYTLYSFYWIFFIDFRLFFRREICNLKDIQHPKREWFLLLAFKSFYITYILLLPWLLTPLTLWQAFLLLLFLHLCGGTLLSYVAVLGHFVEGPVFPPAPNGVVDNSWAEHELEATIDFAPQSWWVNWVTGGLNTHVAHHLFPEVCHVHYRALTPIIADVCREYGMVYQSDSLLGAIRSHFRYLGNLGQEDSVLVTS